jgi:hypothetical protein
MTRNVVMHGGHTDSVPTDLASLDLAMVRRMLLDDAEHHFRRYVAERPQCVFDEPEIWVQEWMTMRGEWRATAYVSWP